MLKKRLHPGRQKLMKIAICDDSYEFACQLKEKLESICAKLDWQMEATVFSSPTALLNADLSAIQVLFLDIDMPGLNGIEVASRIRKHQKDLILVFVTAFIEYAPEGYHVEAYRYLLKQKIDVELLSTMESIYEKLSASTETILIDQKSETVAIPIKNILYLEGTPYRKVLFYLDNSSVPVEVPGKLADYEQRLERKGFLRLQRSFIANMAQISKISSYQVILRNGTVLKASESYYKQVQASFLQWKGQHL